MGHAILAGLIIKINSIKYIDKIGVFGVTIRTFRHAMTDDFQSQLALLRELQGIDLCLEGIARQVDALPEKISDIETAYIGVKEDYDAAKTEFDEVEKARRHEELELNSSAEELRNRESKLYAIKTNKEYQAVLKEIADAKRVNKEREERILTFMEQIEELQKKIAQLEGDLSDKEATFKKESVAIKAQEDELKKQMVEQEARRPDVVSKIDKNLIRRYDHIRQRYADAIAQVMKGVCQGCSMNVTPQLFNEMLKFKELKNCPCCHRLIYVAKDEDKEKT